MDADEQTAMAHDARAAWRRAAVYFVACWALAWGTGTLGRIGAHPIVSRSQLGDGVWWAATLGCVVVVAVGYWVVWPMGTRTYGRPLVADAVVFGVAWGVSEGLLFASVWVTADRAFAGRAAGAAVWVAATTIVVLSTWKGLWHARYWDLHVAPDHNIEAWNLRKVLLVHTPNLVLTTIWVTAYGNLALWVALQTVALLGSAVTMRFPAFRRSAAHA